MMGLVFKFGKARDLVLGICAGTLATQKGCWKLLEHGRLVGCRKNAYFQDAFPSLVEVY